MGRSTDESGLAFAVVASSGVRADRRGSTGISETLVQIHAFGADRLEAVLAEALPLDALGIVDAIEIRLAEGRHVGLKNNKQIGEKLTPSYPSQARLKCFCRVFEKGVFFLKKGPRHCVQWRARTGFPSPNYTLAIL